MREFMLLALQTYVASRPAAGIEKRAVGENVTVSSVGLAVLYAGGELNRRVLQCLDYTAEALACPGRRGRLVGRFTASRGESRGNDKRRTQRSNNAILRSGCSSRRSGNLSSCERKGC